MVVAFIVLIIMAVIVGIADSKDQKTTAGFFGNWILLSALVIVAGGAYFGVIQTIKGNTPLKGFGIFEIVKSYNEVLSDHIGKS